MADTTSASSGSNTSSEAVVSLQFRLLDINGNTITLAPDTEFVGEELRSEGGLRLTGDHTTAAFQAFVRAMRAAGGPYSLTPAIVTGTLAIPTPQAAATTTTAAAAEAAPDTTAGANTDNTGADADDTGASSSAP